MIDSNELRIQRLTKASQIESFRCTDEGLNEFLHEEAKAYQDELLSATYLVYHKSALVAYFSLLNDAVNLLEFDKKTRNRFNRSIPFVKQRAHYPAVKLGRLAVDSRYTNQGIGRFVLFAIFTLVTNNNKSGCRFLTVDALASATRFYQERGGFHFFTDQDQDEDTRLMYFDLKNFK